MAFSFNWAGVNVPTVGVYDGSKETLNSMQNLGMAARGFEKKAADYEYAQTIDEANNAGVRISELEARLERLNARNAEIRKRLDKLRSVPANPSPEMMGNDFGGAQSGEAVV